MSATAVEKQALSEIRHHPAFFPHFHPDSLPSAEALKLLAQKTREPIDSEEEQGLPETIPEPRLIPLSELERYAQFSPLAALELARIYIRGERVDVLHDRRLAEDYLQKYRNFIGLTSPFSWETPEVETKPKDRPQWEWDIYIAVKDRISELRKEQNISAFTTKKYYVLHDLINATRVVMVETALNVPGLLGRLGINVVGNLGVLFHFVGGSFELGVMAKNIAEAKNKTFYQALQASLNKKGRTTRLRNYGVWFPVLTITGVLIALMPLQPVTITASVILAYGVLPLFGFGHDVLLTAESWENIRELDEEARVLGENLEALGEEINLLVSLPKDSSIVDYIRAREGCENLGRDTYIFKEISHRIREYEKQDSFSIRQFQAELEQDRDRMVARQEMIPLERAQAKSNFFISMGVVLFIFSGAVVSAAAIFFVGTPLFSILLLASAAIIALGCLLYVGWNIYGKFFQEPPKAPEPATANEGKELRVGSSMPSLAEPSDSYAHHRHADFFPHSMEETDKGSSTSSLAATSSPAPQYEPAPRPPVPGDIGLPSFAF